MKRFKSLISKDKSRRANNPGYDVLPSDLSTFRAPTELPKVEQEVYRERTESEYRSVHHRPRWDRTSSLLRKEDYAPSVFDLPPTQEELETYMKNDVNAPSEPIVIPPLPTQNSQDSRDLYPPYSSFGSHGSAGNARIPDEDLLEPASDPETKPGLENFLSHPATIARSVTRRRQRRESHNMVERRRRDDINESIRTLAFLAPGGTDRDRPKQAILEKAVSWTRDLMWALHLKTQRESALRDGIRELGGTPFMLDTYDSLDNIEELVIEKEVQLALDTNNITSFSSADQAPRHRRRASEPLKEHSIYHRKTHEHLQPRRLHKVTSRGSIISYVASVHSVTSLTYRSPTGAIETDTREENSNFSYYPNQLKQDQSRRDSHESKYAQDYLTASISGKESPIREPTLSPLGTNDGLSTFTGGISPAPQTRNDPRIFGKMNEKDIKSTEENSTRKGDLVDASKVDNRSPLSRLVAIVNSEGADNDHDARSLARHSDQGASDSKAEGFAVDDTELNGLLKDSNAEIDQDNARHGGRDASGVQYENYSAVYLENGLIRLRWTCVGNVPIL